MAVRFGDFELDVQAYELLQGGNLLKLERIPMELLCLLIDRHGQLVTREQIIKHIWGVEVFVDTDNSINTAIRKLRKALGDDSATPTLIHTVPGKGYRFAAMVEQVTPPHGRFTVGDEKPLMLAVLPFENLSRDSDQEYFSDGLTEETIASLGRSAQIEWVLSREPQQ